MGDFWVFGYGSLIWRPGFPFEERKKATIKGYHRALCIYSWVHRGTREKPGLVFGLDSGGECSGIAYRIAPENQDEVIEYLRERELVTDVYLERWHDIELDGGDLARSLVYVVDRDHAQYAGKLSLTEQTEIIRDAKGKSGENPEYVANTVGHLKELGIRDDELETLARNLELTE